MKKAIGSFVQYQNEAEERFRKWEEQWKKETELKEKLRRED